MDNIEMAEDSMWWDEGPDDPNDVWCTPWNRIRAKVLQVIMSKNKEGKDVATMRVQEENGIGSPILVRSVKHANEVKNFEPGTLVDMKFLINTADDGTVFRNLVYADRIGLTAKHDIPENSVVLSVDHPGTAYGLLVAERNRRRRFFWTQRNGELIDVRDMTDEHLDNTIEMLERVAVSNEEAIVAAEEAYGEKEW